MHSEHSAAVRSFLLQFQEIQQPSNEQDAALECATQTFTKTMEESDQDAASALVFGTATHTATGREDPDHDPRLMATKTMTETSETSDQDPPTTCYFAIPRA